MQSKTKIAAVSFAWFLVSPALGQVTINSSYRMVSADSISYQPFPDDDIIMEDLDETNALGEYTYNAFASADFPGHPSASAEGFLTSSVAPGLIQGSGYANATPWFDFAEYTRAISTVIMEVEFTLDAPSGFNFDLAYDVFDSDYDIVDNMFQFFLGTESDTIYELDTIPDVNGPYVDSVHIDGVLPAGEYTLSMYASPIIAFYHDNTYTFDNTTFDFTLEIPAPSTVAAFAIPAGLVGVRRRRSAG